MDVKLIGGKSVAGNQMLRHDVFIAGESNGITFTDNNDGSITLSGIYTKDAFFYSLKNNHGMSLTARHKYLCMLKGFKYATFYDDSWRYFAGYKSSNGFLNNAYNITTSKNGQIGTAVLAIRSVESGTVISETVYPQLVDLTQMFGAGNEPTLEQCREIFSSESYPYNAGTLTSADVTAVQVGDKVIQLPNSISLKSAGSVYDSLEFYEQDGKYYQKHTQRVGVIDLGTLHTWFRRYPTGYRWSISNWTSDSPKPTWLGIRNILCSAYNDKHISDVYSENTSIGICVNNTYASNTSSIDIDDDRYENLKDFTASLPGVLLYYELATPIVTVTEVDNRFDAVDCKAGDKITFIGNSDYHLPVPNEEEYLIALNEVTA